MASGIVDIPQVAIQGLPFSQSNEWYGAVNGGRVSVGAGSLTKVSDPAINRVETTSTGELVECRVSPDGGVQLLKVVTFPSIQGPWTITAAAGNDLTVTGIGGASFRFNAQTETTAG